MNRTTLIGLLTIGVIIYLAVAGCAPLQWTASAAGGYLTSEEFTEHDGRIDALETRVKALER